MGSVLSLDIGRENIHIVEGSYMKGNIQIEKMITGKVPAGSFNGASISNPELLSEAITDLLHNAGLTAKESILTIDAPSAVVRDIALPNAKPKEVADMIKTEMIQTYHIPPTDVIQYKTITNPVAEPGNQLMNYRVAAVDQEIIESYHNLLLGMKLKPIAMDININAIDKLLDGELIINDKIINGNGTMLIDLGDSLTTIYIVAKSEPIFYRQLDIGSGDIERIISEQTFAPEDDIKKMKEEGYNFFGSDEAAQKYYSIIRPFLYNFTDEIRKIIGFYTRRTNENNVDQIFLFGGGSNLTGFSEYCENNFSIPTEQVMNISKIKSKDSGTSIASYLNAIGALIRNS